MRGFTLGTARPSADMKRLALALLLGAALFYVLATVMQVRHGHAIWPYVAAFAEAAMVGAVADWFAVVALFRHPMGLPIPHTAIIPENKDRIGENLANFLCEHFLSDAQVMGKIATFDVPGKLANWLAQPANGERVAAQLSVALQWVLRALGTPQVREFVQGLVNKGLRHIDIAPLAGQVLSGMTHDRRHQQMLDAAIVQIATWLGNDNVQDRLTEFVAKELRALRYLGLDQVAARAVTNKIVRAVARNLRDMADDPQHELRQRFDTFAEGFVERLQHDAELATRIASWRDALLDSPAVSGYVQQLWDELLDWVDADLQRPESRLSANVAAAVQTIGARLQQDSEVRTWLQNELMRAAPALIARYREDIRRYIVARVHEWDAQELSQELETHIGRDLQFIRINGTLVGGLIGLLIHALTHAALWVAN